ncbi:unnamed protein product, partial [Rotaria magnacalcarata]
MIRLCTTSLWDKNVTHSSYPYLTECFRNTILQWVPMSIFWLILPLWLFVLNRRQIKSQPLIVSRLFINKMILTCLFIFLQMIHIINYFVTSTE